MTNLRTSKKQVLSSGGRFLLRLLRKCTKDTKQILRLSYIGSQLKQQFTGYKKGCVRTLVDELAQLGFVERQGQSGLASVVLTNAGLASVRSHQHEQMAVQKIIHNATNLSTEASMLLKILQNTGLLGGAILLSKLGLLVQKRFPAYKAKRGTMKALVQELVEKGMARLELLSDNLTQQLRVVGAETASQQSKNVAENPVCAHFLQTGKCRYGSRCRFHHSAPNPKRISKPPKAQSLAPVSPEASALLCALRKYTASHTDGVLLSKLAPLVQKRFPAYKANGGTMKSLVQELVDNALVKRHFMPNRVTAKLSLITAASTSLHAQRKVPKPLLTSKRNLPTKRIQNISEKQDLSTGAQCLLKLLANHAKDGVHVVRLSKIGAELKDEFSHYNKGCLRTLVDELTDMGLAQRQGHSGLASIMLKQKAFQRPHEHANKASVLKKILQNPVKLSPLTSLSSVSPSSPTNEPPRPWPWNNAEQHTAAPDMPQHNDSASAPDVSTHSDLTESIPPPGNLSPEAAALLDALSTGPHEGGAWLPNLSQLIEERFPAYKANGGTLDALVQELVDSQMLKHQMFADSTPHALCHSHCRHPRAQQSR